MILEILKYIIGFGLLVFQSGTPQSDRITSSLAFFIKNYSEYSQELSLVNSVARSDTTVSHAILDPSLWPHFMSDKLSQNNTEKH